MDIEFLDIVDGDINMAIPLYIMALHSHYESDNPLITDSYFEKLTKKVLDNWDKLVHNHKYRIANESGRLKFSGEYPRGIENVIRSLKEAYYGKDSTRNSSRRSIT